MLAAGSCLRSMVTHHGYVGAEAKELEQRREGAWASVEGERPDGADGVPTLRVSTNVAVLVGTSVGESDGRFTNVGS